MTEQQLKKYEQVLLAKINSSSGVIPQRDDVGKIEEPDPMDFAREEQDRDVSVNQLNIRTAQRSAIQQALKRIENGEYGICTRCEEAIPTKRLNAIPEAELCLHCQTVAEQQQPNDNFGGEELSLA